MRIQSTGKVNEMKEKTAGEFLSFLRDRGVRLAAEGDRLACNAPKGVLTPELKAELSSRKIDLIEFLTNASLRGTPPPGIHKLDNRTELPLSCGQQRLWFLDLFDSESRAYNISFALEVKGALNCEALEASLHEIVRRHEVLRCRLVNVEGSPRAFPGTGADWRLERAEFRGTKGLNVDEWIGRMAKEESTRRFDLAAGLLFRAMLLQIADHDHVLLLTFHHVAVDGWAIGLFVQELCCVYVAYRDGRPSPLPELVLQYADFAEWQNRQLESGRMQLELEFWRKQLHGPLPALELPTDRPRPSHSMFRGARKRFTLSKELTDAINQFSRDEKSTGFVVLLSAFKVLLQRYTHQDDVVVGSAVAGRNRPELENLVGIFMNNAALRTSLGGDPTVQQLVARVRETSLNAFAHQEIPFDRVVAELHPDRNLNRSPLFQVMFVLHNFPMPSVELPELSVRPLEMDPGTSRFDLTIDATEKGDGSIDLYFEYSTDLFENATIDRLARHFENILVSMAANPSQHISELQMLGADDLSELHAANLETKEEYPRERCIHELFDDQSVAAPDRVAVICGDQEISYAELSRRSNRLANALRRLGVGPERLVGICLERSTSMIVAMLGVLKAGGAYVPMDPHFPRERLEWMARDSALNVLLTDEQSRDLLDVPGATVLSLSGNGQEISQESEEAPARVVTSENRAYVIYTSGSTGVPKGVQIAHRSVVNFLRSMQRKPGLSAEDRLLSVTTLSFDISGLEVFLPLITGGAVVLAPRAATADGRMLARLLVESNATVMQATPATWRLLLESGWTGKKDLRILCGGDTLPRELASRLLPMCAVLWNLYGPTETTIWSTLHEVTAGDGPVPIGKPIANTEVYVLDAHAHPVPPGVSGELYLGGDGLGLGYLNRPELTAEKFVPHPFRAGERLYRTGDLVRTLPGGTLQFLGRLDNQVKIRGFRVELGEIETVLKRCEGVSDATVILREDVPGDQRLVAYVVPSHSAVMPAPYALRAELLKTLPEYMVPFAFVTQRSFPLTPNRKTDRRALPLPGIDSLPPDTHASPSSEDHRVIASIWKELLNRDTISIHENFFDSEGTRCFSSSCRIGCGADSGGNSRSWSSSRDRPSRRWRRRWAGVMPRALRPRSRVNLHRAGPCMPERGAKSESIAVIGMAGRFPDAPDLQTFWQNLARGVESLIAFSDEEILASGVDPRQLRNQDYVKKGTILEGAEWFDASFFGFNPREAEVLDPQQRVFLECAWEAMEDAGYGGEGGNRSVGVYAGESLNSYVYSNVLPNSDLVAAVSGYQMMLSSDKDFLATRVAYKLNLKGPAISIQTACSTSLVAIQVACQSLLGRQCDMAISGGVSIGFPPKSGYLYTEGMILSPDGTCRPFDAQARGTRPGAGSGAVVLKRLEDALRDHDSIRAVIKGSAINNDGSSKMGYTAPSADGQARVVEMAQAMAGVDPASISYIEAHGTATVLGDPIEFAALDRVFRARTDRRGFCALGSVKSNIGHLDAAAGIAGVIKTVLALEHELIPPTLHYREPNPRIDLAGSPFFVNDKALPWKATDGPRRAGVSSFGIGGTNAHVVLEEAPARSPSGVSRRNQLIVLSAKTAAALDASTLKLERRLSSHSEAGMADAAYTLQVGRKRFPYRRFVVCSSREESAEALSSSRGVAVASQESVSRPVCFLFSGQGSQHLGMAEGLYHDEPEFRKGLDECALLLRPHLGCDVRDVLYPAGDRTEDGPAACRLNETWLTQPALFAVEYSLARMWMSWGIVPDACLGHSIGEYVAACLAGVFSLADALALVSARGRLMQSLPRGSMLAVPLPAEEVKVLLDGTLSLAAENTARLCTVSGPDASVGALENDLRARGVACRRIPASHAFHSAMMDGAVESFSESIHRVELSPPNLPILSNVTGTWMRDEEATDPAYWVLHMRRTVRFADGLRRLLNNSGRILLEVGPGQTLGAFAREMMAPSDAAEVLFSLPHRHDSQPASRFVLQTLGRLWTGGAAVDWEGFHGHESLHRVSLPTYPFERQRYCVEADPVAPRAGAAKAGAANKITDIADWFYVPSWKRSIAPSRLISRTDPRSFGPWLLFLDETGLGAHVAAVLADRGQRFATVRPGKDYGELDEVTYMIDPGNRAHYDLLIRALQSKGSIPHSVMHLWNVTGAAEASGDRNSSFYSLLYLAQAFGELQVGQPLNLIAVADALHSVCSGNEPVQPAKALLIGPCKVIPQEYPGIVCRAVDVASPGEAAAHLAENLILEPGMSAATGVVAYRQGFRWEQIFEPLRLRRDPGRPFPRAERNLFDHWRIGRDRADARAASCRDPARPSGIDGPHAATPAGAMECAAGKCPDGCDHGDNQTSGGNGTGGRRGYGGGGRCVRSCGHARSSRSGTRALWPV